MTDLTAMNPNQLVDDVTAGEFLAVKTTTLSVWRVRGTIDLPFVKVGKNVRYRVGDLLAFIERNSHGGRAA